MTITTAEEVVEEVAPRFNVIAYYCHGEPFMDDHRTIEFAASQYTRLAAVMVEDAGAEEITRHLRSVHMLVFNEGSPDAEWDAGKGGTLRSHIDTGVVPCSHRR